MQKYELMIIFDPSYDEEEASKQLDKYFAPIVADGGKVDDVNVWGKRRMAYEIQKHREGVYAVVKFTAKVAGMKELERVMRLQEDILRIKILKNDE
ncbi:MAG: 30S ribosomal protein S6 [Bifidobacteriaceae bacterium]|jgi:small subunit ribosomal protein S6|nr:30S ribosomal protein S6 [Bifidobacteriaceae bacterium]